MYICKDCGKECYPRIVSEMQGFDFVESGCCWAIVINEHGAIPTVDEVRKEINKRRAKAIKALADRILNILPAEMNYEKKQKKQKEQNKANETKEQNKANEAKEQKK